MLMVSAIDQEESDRGCQNGSIHPNPSIVSNKVIIADLQRNNKKQNINLQTIF